MNTALRVNLFLNQKYCVILAMLSNGTHSQKFSIDRFNEHIFAPQCQLNFTKFVCFKIKN